MRKYFVACILLATNSFAQHLAPTVPFQPPAEAKYKIRKIFQDASQLPVQTVIELSVQSSTDNELRYFNVSIPSEACGTLTSAGLETARRTPAAGEPAGVLASTQYRLLKALADNGCGLPASTLSQ